MTPKQRTGLLAAGIVGGLFLSVACLVTVLVISGRNKSTEPVGDKRTTKELADRPISEGNEKDDESYIIGHRWWNRPISKQQLDSLVKVVIETSSGNTVLVQRDASTERHVHQVADTISWDDTFWVRIRQSKRPDRAEVLQAIRSALDRAEYRDGPGR